MGGCSLKAEQLFTGGVSAAVEVALAVSGMALRVRGVAQWIGDGNTVGIRFDQVSPSTKNELAALLTCLIDEGATSTVLEAVAAVEDRGELEALSVRIPEIQEGEGELVRGRDEDGG